MFMNLCKFKIYLILVCFIFGSNLPIYSYGLNVDVILSPQFCLITNNLDVQVDWDVMTINEDGVIRFISEYDLLIFDSNDQIVREFNSYDIFQSSAFSVSGLRCGDYILNVQPSDPALADQTGSIDIPFAQEDCGTPIVGLDMELSYNYNFMDLMELTFDKECDDLLADIDRIRIRKLGGGYNKLYFGEGGDKLSIPTIAFGDYVINARSSNVNGFGEMLVKRFSFGKPIPVTQQMTQNKLIQWRDDFSELSSKFQVRVFDANGNPIFSRVINTARGEFRNKRHSLEVTHPMEHGSFYRYQVRAYNGVKAKGWSEWSKLKRFRYNGNLAADKVFTKAGLKNYVSNVLSTRYKYSLNRSGFMAVEKIKTANHPSVSAGNGNSGVSGGEITLVGGSNVVGDGVVISPPPPPAP